MITKLLQVFLLILAAGVSLTTAAASTVPPMDPISPDTLPAVEDPNGITSINPLQYSPMAVFRYPVVDGVVISGYFDHSQAGSSVVHYNGKRNTSTSYGYTFKCENPYMRDFVGCSDPVIGEAACANNREVWYDGHKGTDYEFASNWHTGEYCNPGKFSGLTRYIYAPAAGWVQFAGYNASRPGNGWHVILKHDLNKDGNYNNDNLRTYYLHFTPNMLDVSSGQYIGENQRLGLGGTSGYSSSPHLHFEVQRSTDNFTSNIWSVDPYGWQGSFADPWPYQNVSLWRMPVINLPLRLYLPAAGYVPPSTGPGSGDLLSNGGFESGRVDWVEVGVDIIANTSHPTLPILPYSGNWLGWMGGRNNASDTLYQTFRVPQGVTSAVLVYYLRVDTQERGGVYDRMTVHLRAANGDPIRQLDSFDNNFSPAGQWVRREIDLSDLVSRQGEQMRISLEAATDSNMITHFYLDEVTLIAQSNVQ